jgi:ubiquinone/menaquinone biosynthesis C-methylase UbiE
MPSANVSALRRATNRLLELPLVYQAWQAPFANAKLEPFLGRVGPERLRRVLDIGCGPGTNARVFAGADEYVGIDINPNYIRQASSRYAGRFVVGDVTDENIFPNEQFDCVFANSLMHHLDDASVRSLLGRMARLAAPGGKVHVLDLVLPPNASPGRVLAQLDRGRFARPVEHWRRLFMEHMRAEHFQPYSFGLPLLPLWKMVYFVGVPK